MEQADNLVLKETLERIQKALNQRFEKNADLYIPVEEIERIKEALYEGKYGLLEGLMKANKYPAEILTKVFIKNAWLIGLSKKGKHAYGPLFEVMGNCKHTYLDELMSTEVFNNSLDMDKKIRIKLIENYIHITDKNICSALFCANAEFLNNPRLRVRCLLKVNEKEKSQNMYDIIQSEAEKHPGIISEIAIFRRYFASRCNEASMHSFIFNKQFGPTESANHKFWRDVFPDTFYEGIINLAKNYMIEHRRINDYNGFNDCRQVLNKVFPLSIRNENCIEAFLNCVNEFLISCEGEKGWRDKCISNIYIKCREQNMSYISMFEDLMKKHNVCIENKELPDIDGILQILAEQNISSGKWHFLAIAFDKQYSEDVDTKVEYLYKKSNRSERVIELLQQLMNTRQTKFQYLVCYISKFAKINDKYRKYAMKYVHDNNILRKSIRNRFRVTIHDFVKKTDFAAYRNWTK